MYGIFTYIWLKIQKYSIHGAHGYQYGYSTTNNIKNYNYEIANFAPENMSNWKEYSLEKPSF